MKTIKWASLRPIWFGALFIHSSGNAIAQETTLVRTAVKEIVEVLGKQGGKAATKELAELGGEIAVRETLEAVAKETGEQGVKEVVELCGKYGLDAVRAARCSPGRTAKMVGGIAEELRPAALKALARKEDIEVLTRIPSELAQSGLEAAARHPGVGAQVVDHLGTQGATLTNRLTTDEIIKVARQMTEIERLDPVSKRSLTDAIVKSPKQILDYLETHPRILASSTGITILLANKEAIFGGKGDVQYDKDGNPQYIPKPGLLERSVIQPLMRYIVPIVACILAMWGGGRVYWGWKTRRLKYEMAKSKSTTQRDQS